jgi:hypothetical protein
MDRHGNVNAEEGCTRCICGSKYWENDACIDCGTLVEVVQLRNLADRMRFGNEVQLNVMVTTMTHYAGLVGFKTNHDLVDVMAKYRTMGVIQ